MFYHLHRTDGSGFTAVAEAGDGLPFEQTGEVWAPDQWSINWHTHPGWELYFQAKGESWWEIGSDHVKVPEGGAYLIAEGVRHRVKRMGRGGVHFFWVVFPTATVPAVACGAECWRRPWTVLTRAHDILHPFQGIVREAAIKECWQSEACGWYAAVLATTFARLAENLVGEKPLARHPASERAQRLLASRLEHPWRLAELARLSGVSAAHLIELFRADYGQTPMRALVRLRLEEARRRLRETDATVTDIALELGFSSSQHFARRFRAEFKHTPTSARKRSG